MLSIFTPYAGVLSLFEIFLRYLVSALHRVGLIVYILVVDVIIVLQRDFARLCFIDTKVGNIVPHWWEPHILAVYISVARVCAVAEKSFAKRVVPRHYVYVAVVRIGVHLDVLFALVIFICELNVEVSHIIRCGVDIGE